MELKQIPGWCKRSLYFVSALFFLSIIIYGQNFLLAYEFFLCLHINYVYAIQKCIWLFHSQLQQFWIASSILIKSQWRKLLQFIGDDDYYLYVWGKFLNTNV